MTLQTPFSQYTRDLAAATAAQRGERPSKPPNPRFFTPDLFHLLWELLEDMWARDPLVRTNAEMVADRLREILEPPDNPMETCSDAMAGMYLQRICIQSARSSPPCRYTK